MSWLVLWGPDPTETALNVGAVLAILNWIGGGVHAAVVSDSAVRRISTRNDPAIEATAARIELRAQGQDLLETRSAIARDIGVGRPDVPGAHDYGLIDVNHCPASTLTRPPGITDELAQQIADGREQAGGYSSVEDLGMLLTLPPATVELLRDLTVFPPI